MWQIFMENLTPFAEAASRILTQYPISTTPLWAVITLPLAAVVALALARGRRWRHFRFRRVFAAMVSPAYLRHRSHRLDVLMMLGNVGLFALIAAQFIVTVAAIHALTTSVLTSLFGAPTLTALDPALIALIWAVMMFFAGEFAYFLDHYLSHKIPFLWEFHKVHHSAEVLSPLTNFRVHPVDSIVYLNTIGVVKGITAGALSYGFGTGVIEPQMWGVMAGVAALMMLNTQAQHSHIWLPFRGWVGCILMSPAHHQLHHSSDPAHHDRNFGNTFAGFDWLFGTLCMPAKKRPKLTFGVDSNPHPQHSLQEALFDPFAAVARQVVPAPMRSAGVSADPITH